MIVLHAAPVDFSRIGGLHYAVPGLIQAQNAINGVDVALLLTAGRKIPLAPVDFPIITRSCFRRNFGRVSVLSPYGRPDLVIIHSTYIPWHASFGSLLRRMRIPYIIVPHGGMTKSSMRQKATKKQIGNFLFFNKLVAGCSALHCLTAREAEETAHWKRPIFVVGNGVELPPPSDLAIPGASHRLRFIFIGRLATYHKGLDLLIDACALIKRPLQDSEARVLLCGPGEVDNVRGLRAKIASFGLQSVVEMPGAVLGDAKRLAP